MRPKFFGSSAQPLFGVYHAARGKRSRDSAVLLCNPGPQEYMRSHWAFRRLADTLSSEGYHVLRFDYFGSGDSAGASDAADLATWRSNIETAAAELRDSASLRKLSAVGFRLGATLAAQSGLALERLVLWEPVVHGPSYLDELERAQQAYLNMNPFPPWKLRNRPAELLGLPLPHAHERELREIDLTRNPPPKAASTTIMISEQLAAFRALKTAWESAGSVPDLRHVPDRAGAAERGEMQAALLSHNMLQAILTYFV